MRRREKLIYAVVGGLLVTFVLAGVILRSVLRGGVDNALASLPENYVVLKVDIGAAWDRALEDSDGGRPGDFEILENDVTQGDPALVSSGWVNEDDRVIAVRFNGYWPDEDGRPMVLREDALVIRRTVDYLAGTPAITEVQAVGDVDDAGVLTFVLGPRASD